MDKNNRAVKTVLITGSTGGIGTELALEFARQGWDVIAHYYSSDAKAARLKKMVEDLGVKCHTLKSDLTSQVQTSRLIKALGRFQVDSIINNAGTYVAGMHFARLAAEDIADTFMVNTFAPILITSGIFMKMKDRRFGRIVNISSIAAKYGGSANSLHYGCSKRALEGLTKTLAREGADSNVLVNTVRLGVIDTDFHKKYPKDMKKRISMIPVKRMGSPDEVAAIIYYLGSAENGFITNETITVAGGE